MTQQVKNYLDYYIKIQDNFSFISLGGSLPLMIYGKIPFRDIKDFDIISTQYISTNEIIHKAFNIEPKNKPEYSMLITHEGCNFDLYLNPNATYDYISFEGYNLRLSPLEEIIFFKSKKLLQGGQKDINDFQSLINNIQNGKNNKI
jgi:hypothetical protein